MLQTVSRHSLLVLKNEDRFPSSASTGVPRSLARRQKYPHPAKRNSQQRSRTTPFIAFAGVKKNEPRSLPCQQRLLEACPEPCYTSALVLSLSFSFLSAPRTYKLARWWRQMISHARTTAHRFLCTCGEQVVLVRGRGGRLSPGRSNFRVYPPTSFASLFFLFFSLFSRLPFSALPRQGYRSDPPRPTSPGSHAGVADDERESGRRGRV